MTWHYRIFKFTTHDWLGNTLAPERHGAPLYGLFEVYQNEQGGIWARTQTPELTLDTLGESTNDPALLFKQQLTTMLQDVERPVLEEPFAYAPPDHDVLQAIQ